MFFSQDSEPETTSLSLSPPRAFALPATPVGWFCTHLDPPYKPWLITPAGSKSTILPLLFADRRGLARQSDAAAAAEGLDDQSEAILRKTKKNPLRTHHAPLRQRLWALPA